MNTKKQTEIISGKPKRLQRAWADVEHPVHVLIVHPFTHFLFTVPMADGIKGGAGEVGAKTKPMQLCFIQRVI